MLVELLLNLCPHAACTYRNAEGHEGSLSFTFHVWPPSDPAGVYGALIVCTLSQEIRRKNVCVSGGSSHYHTTEKTEMYLKGEVISKDCSAERLD
jgi:hypothetical protein